MNETLSKTSLADVQPGAGVNLELPLRPSDRLGGHVVQGHVDGLATIAETRDDGFARRVRFETDPELLRYVVEKGSIALDGVSLTVIEIGDSWFTVSLIPEIARAHEPGGGRAWYESERGGRRVGEIRGKADRQPWGQRMSSVKTPFSTIEEAIEDIRQGKMVVVCDDENRENEGDLTMAAQFVTPEAINFMRKEGGGLICLALTPDRCDELGLDLMAAKNESAFETAFTVSVEARSGVSTGISAADRARTIQVAIDPKSSPRELVQPGHVFPLKAKAGGVLERVGQTEAAVDLARLAGLNPSGVICEIMNEDGSMARVRDLEPYCARHEHQDGHGRRPGRLPPPAREARRARRLDEAPDVVRGLRRRRVPVAGRQQAPRRARQGRGRRRGGRARPRALRMPDRRRLPLAALRLRRAARVGARR